MQASIPSSRSRTRRSSSSSSRTRPQGKDTYPAGRFLYAEMPKDGEVVLDFNKAYSPPCAFTSFATCPLPPRQNRLDVRIEAGEKKPPGTDRLAPRLQSSSSEEVRMPRVILIGAAPCSPPAWVDAYGAGGRQHDHVVHHHDDEHDPQPRSRAPMAPPDLLAGRPGAPDAETPGARLERSRRRRPRQRLRQAPPASPAAARGRTLSRRAHPPPAGAARPRALLAGRDRRPRRREHAAGAWPPSPRRAARPGPTRPGRPSTQDTRAHARRLHDHRRGRGRSVRRACPRT